MNLRFEGQDATGTSYAYIGEEVFAAIRRERRGHCATQIVDIRNGNNIGSLWDRYWAPTYKDAKALVIAHVVAQRLEQA